MLKRLEIQNYAIIDKLEIFFPSGLTIITGETGAGKSILLGALGLILGKRADSKVLYDQDRKCYVDAIFEIKAYALKSFFEQNDLEYDDEVAIRREIAPSGRSRAFINDSPVTLDILQALSAYLIDIHQQFDTLNIQDSAFQTKMLDAIGDNKIILAQYEEIYKNYSKNIKLLETWITKNQAANQEIEYLKYQLEEFNQTELKRGELEDLESILRRLTSAEDILKISTLLTHSLDGDENSLINQLQSLILQFSSIKKLDKDYLDIYDRMNVIKEDLSDIAKEAEKIAESVEYDEEEIQKKTSRLNALNRLLKKHNVTTLDELLNVEADILSKLNSFSDLSNDIDALEIELSQQKSNLEDLAHQISANRKRIIPAFENNVHQLLSDLSMPHAYILVQIQPTTELTSTGMDIINIHFAPNKGSTFLPVKDIASGGEMSRLALCMKSLVAGATTLPTLVLDEIDTGVSGDVAQKIGTILSNLSKNHQVITITHSPQIAAKAECHYWVYKIEDDLRTKTSMRQLSIEERITEIATMLSRNPPSDAAKANAKGLLGL